MHRPDKNRTTSSSFVGSAEKNDYNLEEARNDDVVGNNGMDREKRQVSGSTDFNTSNKQQRPLANALTLMNTAHYYLSVRSPIMYFLLINAIVFIIGIGGTMLSSSSQGQRFGMLSSPSPRFSEEWVVLLTTCRGREDESSTKHHEAIYLKQIAQWARNSSLPIFVIESSGMGFPELEGIIPTTNIIQEKLKHHLSSSSSISEAESLLEASRKMNEYEIMKEKKYILKVTGRYYLEGVKDIIDKKLTPGKDFYVQRHYNNETSWQNTEYYGIRKELLPELANRVLQDHLLMEETFYAMTRNKNASYEFFGNGFPNDQARGGDKLIINPLR